MSVNYLLLSSLTDRKKTLMKIHWLEISNNRGFALEVLCDFPDFLWLYDWYHFSCDIFAINFYLINVPK